MLHGRMYCGPIHLHPMNVEKAKEMASRFQAQAARWDQEEAGPNHERSDAEDDLVLDVQAWLEAEGYDPFDFFSVAQKTLDDLLRLWPMQEEPPHDLYHYVLDKLQKMVIFVGDVTGGGTPQTPGYQTMHRAAMFGFLDQLEVEE